MALHLVKLCVGVDSVEHLKSLVDERAGADGDQRHPTRMTPTRRPEILAGGSLYWVIKGQVQVRQPILDLQPFVDRDGIARCHIVLERRFVTTEWQPRRPFQGWRYLQPCDAPPDAAGEGDFVLPPKLRSELYELGLL